MSGAVIGLCASVFITTAVMLLANYFITPIYAKFVGFPLDIVEVLPKLILPFNLTKSVLNSALVLLLYKPFTTALKATTLVPKGSTSNTTSSKVTVITAATAIILLAAALLIYLTVLGGSIQLFKF